MLPQVADDIDVEFLFGCGSGNAIDEEAGEEADECEGKQRIAGIDFMAAEFLGHGCAGDGADDDGEERAEFNDTVAPGQSLGGKQFREQTVFGWTEKRGLRGDKHERDERNGQRMHGQANCGHNHGANLHDLGPDGDLALAEAVSEPAAGHAEEHEGQGEQQCDDGDEGLAPALLKVHANNDGKQQIAEDVVAIGTLELRGNEGPEAACAARLLSRGGRRFAGESGFSCSHKGRV